MVSSPSGLISGKARAALQQIEGVPVVHGAPSLSGVSGGAGIDAAGFNCHSEIMSEIDLEDARLVRVAGELWRQGTRARFLDGIADGTLPRQAFDRWLVQDYLFVSELTRFASILAARAGREAQRVIIGGLGALNDELDWFERHAAERGLSLEAERLPVCRRYVDYLMASAYMRPVEVLLVVFFGVEVSYCVGWGRLRPAKGAPQGPYAEFIDRWTHPAFAEYVKALEKLADGAEHSEQQTEFNRVMTHEGEFWEMTVGGAGGQ
jgi:formylaminopyrimidine deformylase / aminopyrimidine aminohydrolase